MNLTGQPIHQKGAKPVPKPKKQMRRVAKGKKSSSDCPIMKSAEGEQCLADWCGCNGSRETTAMRHIRKFGIGGMGSKPPNFIGFYGCQEAEDIFALKGGEGWEWEGLMRAMVLTQMKLARKDLLHGGEVEYVTAAQQERTA